MLKDSGAKEIHFRVASPPIVSPCFLGINTQNKNKLLANKYNIKKIGEIIGADTLDFLTLKNLEISLNKKTFCKKCFL